jgi:biotin carboxylase
MAKRDPRALLFTTQRWPAAAMMARSLRDGGFQVGALCPPGHPLRKSKSAVIVRHHRHLTGPLGLARAIANWRPDILVACDDLAVDAAHRVWRHYAVRGDAEGREKAQVIEASFGRSTSFDIARNKSKVLGVAAALGIATPCSTVVEDLPSLVDRLQTLGYPAVLKADALWGGLGVRVVGSEQEARFAFHQLTQAPSGVEVAKSVAQEAGLQPIVDRLCFRPPVISVQRFVPGRPANLAAVCWQGEMLGGVTVEVLENQRNNGPGSVVRVIENTAMEWAAARLIGELGLSGFCGFDFMLDRDSGEALLLEINPRMTSSSYLPTLTGTTLARLLCCRLKGFPATAARRAPTQDGVVVLFPQELERDPSSPNLRAPSHLVPWDEPALVAECIRLTFAQSLPARLFGYVRSLARSVPLQASEAR